MLLLDIGNTNIKSYKDGTIVRTPAKQENLPHEKFYYINVNTDLHNLLEENIYAIDLSPWFRFSTKYEGMGIDRIAACYTVDNGIVVDAGSAVTVDIMREKEHKGGFIMPGLSSYKECFANISSKLQYDLNRELSLEKLPLNTNDALLYATLKSVVLMIQNSAENTLIFMTGGDGERLCKYLKNCIYKEDLVFAGMQKAIKEMGNVC